MKEYPSINREYNKDIIVYSFPKYDGSLIRCQYSEKRGFYKFGSKTVLIDNSTPIYGEAINLFKNKYEVVLSDFFRSSGHKNGMAFCEFYGENSIFGNHKQDDKNNVILLDVSVNDILLGPAEFMDNFDHLHIPALLHNGYADDDFIAAVRESKQMGASFEGVVCKGLYNKKEHIRPMFKIKTNAWIEKLKEHCNGNADLFSRLL